MVPSLRRGREEAEEKTRAHRRSNDGSCNNEGVTGVRRAFGHQVKRWNPKMKKYISARETAFISSISRKH